MQGEVMEETIDLGARYKDWLKSPDGQRSAEREREWEARESLRREADEKGMSVGTMEYIRSLENQLADLYHRVSELEDRFKQ